MTEQLDEAAAEPPLDCRVMPLPLGTETQWGTIEMVGLTGGERYYWMVNRLGGKSAGVSMIPAFMVEAEHNVTRRASARSLLTAVLDAAGERREQEK